MSWLRRRVRVPPPHVALQSSHGCHACSVQSIGHFPELHTTVSRSAPTHLLPAPVACRCTLRERDFVPPPQVRVHWLNAVHGSSTQSCAQGFVLHVRLHAAHIWTTGERCRGCSARKIPRARLCATTARLCAFVPLAEDRASACGTRTLAFLDCVIVWLPTRRATVLRCHKQRTKARLLACATLVRTRLPPAPLSHLTVDAAGLSVALAPHAACAGMSAIRGFCDNTARARLPAAAASSIARIPCAQGWERSRPGTHRRCTLEIVKLGAVCGTFGALSHRARAAADADAARFRAN